jgi:hypothetical protein
MRIFTIEEILAVMRRKGYRIFTRDDKPYNLNIVGVRNSSAVPNYFDDQMYLIWKHRGVWNVKMFAITTDPGTYWLMNPMMVQGTAILKEGQYLGLWKLGLHKGYEALVQSAPCTVIRDVNRNNRLDFNGPEEAGFFGINCHKATSRGVSETVDKWSAGCQVHPDSQKYDSAFMAIIKEGLSIWGERVSYTLLNERDFVR